MNGHPRIARCPRCKESTRLDAGNRWRPFCSERCKLIDLGGWLEGRFALPVVDADNGGDAAGDDEPAPRR